MQKAYRGHRQEVISCGAVRDGKCVVWIRHADGKERRLNPHTDLVDYAPEGFDWGHEGSAPRQLAFALAYDVTKDGLRAMNVCDELMQRTIAALPHRGWTLTETELLATILAIEADDNGGKQ